MTAAELRRATGGRKPLAQKRPPVLAKPGWSFTITIPVKVVSELNARGHWGARHRRFKGQAAAVRAAWLTSPLAWWGGKALKLYLPLTVTLVRLGGRPLDGDNLAGAFKAVRDELAHLIGCDDADPRITWEYRQEPGGDAGVRVAVAGG